MRRLLTPEEKRALKAANDELRAAYKRGTFTSDGRGGFRARDGKYIGGNLTRILRSAAHGGALPDADSDGDDR